jgi:hypothetical protein
MLLTHALAIVPYLFLGALSKMVYEHLSRCFILEDPSLGFLELFQAIVVIARGDIPRSMALMLSLTYYWQWQKTLEIFILLP